MADVGRPLLYSDPEKLAEMCEDYFAQIELAGRNPTITGLTYFLGFADKTTLYDYRDRPEFSHPIKRAILRVEMGYEAGLTEQSVAGRIFALKNMGWKDKTEHEQYGKDGGPIENTLQIKIIRDKGNADPISDTPLESTESN